MTNTKVALVTGASSGIGFATAKLLIRNGYIVFGTSREPELHGSEGFTLLPLDVRSEESVQQCVEIVLTKAKRIDLLVNNAGYGQIGAIEENSVAAAKEQFDTNVFGTMQVINAVLPTMRQQGSGHIINVSTILGLIALPYAGLYSASKFALGGLSEALRSEVAPFNIAVSLVEPGTVNTSFVSLPPAHPATHHNAARQSVLGSLQQSNHLDPIAVAEVIVKIAETPRPHLHNVIGGRIRLFATLKRLLPEPAFERVRNRIFRIPTGNNQSKQLQAAPR
jgi:short-subunit dehydrogenase